MVHKDSNMVEVTYNIIKKYNQFLDSMIITYKQQHKINQLSKKDNQNIINMFKKNIRTIKDQI